MAKEKTEAEIREKKERKEKKDKKRKHDEAAEDVEIVAEKKKKEKKRKSPEVDADGDVIVDTTPGASMAMVVKDEDAEDKKPVVVRMEIPLAALVPFANPLCDAKSQKKVFKGVKRAAKHKSLKRGVKEVVKCIRKSPLATPSTPITALPNGIVILAADISPMDVISHIPVLCEDHNIPYMYVPSRAELGAASSTKRPTSVVMLMPKAKKGADEKTDEKEEWEEQFRDLHKLSLKLNQTVRV